MSEIVTTLEHQQQEEDETDSPFWHCYCDVCNEGREVAISICGARESTSKEGKWQPEGPTCVVCEEMALQPCPGCGR